MLVAAGSFSGYYPRCAQSGTGEAVNVTVKSLNDSKQNVSVSPLQNE